MSCSVAKSWIFSGCASSPTSAYRATASTNRESPSFAIKSAGNATELRAARLRRLPRFRCRKSMRSSTTKAWGAAAAAESTSGTLSDDQRAAGSSTGFKFLAFSDPSPSSPYKTLSCPPCDTPGAGPQPIAMIVSRGQQYPRASTLDRGTSTPAARRCDARSHRDARDDLGTARCRWRGRRRGRGRGRSGRTLT